MQTKQVFLLPIEVLLKKEVIYETKIRTFNSSSSIIPYRAYKYDFSITESMVKQFGKVFEVPTIEFDSTFVKIEDFIYKSDWFIDVTPASKLLYKD